MMMNGKYLHSLFFTFLGIIRYRCRKSFSLSFFPFLRGGDQEMFVLFPAEQGGERGVLFQFFGGGVQAPC